MSPTQADSLRASRGRQAGSRAAGTAVLHLSGVWQRSSRVGNTFCSPFPKECHGFLRTRVNNNVKVGFPPGMEEPKWQGTAAGFALCSISALEAVAVRMSQLSAAGSSDLMTAFHQQSSCHFCLFSFCACLAMQVASSTQKSPAAQVREKGSRLFAVLGREKVLHQCSSTSLLICRFLFPWAF